MHLFCAGEPLSFVHPLIRQAVEQSISPLARGHEHARAAQILDRTGSPRRSSPRTCSQRPHRPTPRTVDDSPRRRAQGAGQRRREQRRRTAAPGARGGLTRRPRQSCSPSWPRPRSRRGSRRRPAASERARSRCARTHTSARSLALTLGAAHYRKGNYADAVMVLAGAMLDARHDDPQLADGDRRRALLRGHASSRPWRPRHSGAARSCSPRCRSSPPRPSAPRWRTWPSTRRSSASRASRCVGWPTWPGATASCWRPTAFYARAGRWWPARCTWSTSSSGPRAVRRRRGPRRTRATRPTRSRSPITAGRGRCTSAGTSPPRPRPPARQSTSCPASGLGYFPSAYAAIACCHIQQGRLDEAESALAVIEHPQLHRGDRPAGAAGHPRRAAAGAAPRRRRRSRTPSEAGRHLGG